MRRRITILFLITVLSCLCTYAYLVQSEQRAIAAQLIRLHVVANSDDDADQSLKLCVRDEVLRRVTALTADCADRAEAEAVLRENLPQLRLAAERTLADGGAAQQVAVRLCTESFPRRDYDTFSLPAGDYLTLRVTLGRGEGHNWWCVAFPALCLPATTETFITAAEESGLSSEQTDLLSGGDTAVELKFRVLDWLRDLLG